MRKISLFFAASLWLMMCGISAQGQTLSVSLGRTTVPDDYTVHLTATSTGAVVTKGFQFRKMGTTAWTTTGFSSPFSADIKNLPDGKWEYRAFVRGVGSPDTLFTPAQHVQLILCCTPKTGITYPLPLPPAVDCSSSTTYGTDVQEACGSYKWIDGKTYTSSNDSATYTIAGGNSVGCDSIVTLNLTINPAKLDTVPVTISTSDLPYTFRDTTLKAAGIYVLKRKTSLVCDSIVVLNLIVLSPSEACAAKGGVMIKGVCWATSNVDMPGTFAANPEDAGMYYQWNRPIGWSSTDPIVNSNGGGEKTWNSSMPTGTEWTTANNVCPTGWHVPTQSEMKSLLVTANTTYSWVKLNGVNCMKFSDGTNSICLPTVRARSSYDGSLGGNVNYSATYWSSTDGSSTCGCAYYLSFSMSTNAASLSDTGYRWFGYSVRCVAD